QRCPGRAEVPEARRRGFRKSVPQERPWGNRAVQLVHGAQAEGGVERDRPLKPGSLRHHSRYAGSLPYHERMLTERSGVLGAFQPELEGSGLVDRAAVLVFSEFGRDIAENATHRTDDGTAAPVFIIGGAIRGGRVGTTPSLTDLEDGDLKSVA